jgi:hypothetical protein
MHGLAAHSYNKYEIMYSYTNVNAQEGQNHVLMHFYFGCIVGCEFMHLDLAVKISLIKLAYSELLKMGLLRLAYFL